MTASEIRAKAFRRLMQAAKLFALADCREREAATTPSEWIALHSTRTVEGYPFRGRVVVDAAKRGELEVSGGRPPRVRRAELEAWLARRRIQPRAPATQTDADRSGEYDAIVDGASP